MRPKLFVNEILYIFSFLTFRHRIKITFLNHELRDVFYAYTDFSKIDFCIGNFIEMAKGNSDSFHDNLFMIMGAHANLTNIPKIRIPEKYKNKIYESPFVMNDPKIDKLLLPRVVMARESVRKKFQFSKFEQMKLCRRVITGAQIITTYGQYHSYRYVAKMGNDEDHFAPVFTDGTDYIVIEDLGIFNDFDPDFCQIFKRVVSNKIEINFSGIVYIKNKNFFIFIRTNKTLGKILNKYIPRSCIEKNYLAYFIKKQVMEKCIEGEEDFDHLIDFLRFKTNEKISHPTIKKIIRKHDYCC